jgi:hypothetical protein
MAMRPAGLRPEKGWAGEARPLVRECALRQQSRNCPKIIKERGKTIGRWPHMGA